MTRKTELLLTLAWMAIAFAVALGGMAVVSSRISPGSVAWDVGGIDTDGVFLCAGAYDQTVGTFTANPLADFFPALVRDC